MNRTRLQKCATLPTLPAVAMKVVELCQSLEPSISQVAEVITTDPALAARVLRMSNSPMFGLRQPVSKVSHAISMLGLNTVRTMALSLSLAQTMKGKQRWFPTFWKRSVLTATAAREIASVLLIPQKEEAFLIGLLQDVGILALSQIDRNGYDAVADDVIGNHEALIAREREAYGCDHAKVGAWLVESWQMPDSFVQAVLHSHDIGKADNMSDEALQLLKIGVVAAQLADIWLDGDCAQNTKQARSSAREWLGTNDFQFSSLLERMKDSIEEVTSLFDMPIGSPEEIEGMLQEAREALLLLTVAEQNARPKSASSIPAAPSVETAL